MPTSLKQGQNFEIIHKTLPSSYAMSSLDSATDHYNIGYVVSGDRKTILLNGHYEVHAGYITIMAPYIYHRTVSLSSETYERYQIKFTEEIAAPLIQQIGPTSFEQLNNLMVIPIDLNHQQFFLQQFIEMEKFYQSDEGHKDFILQGMLNRLVLSLLSYYDQHHKNFNQNFTRYTAPLNQQIFDAIFYIEKNYMKDPSLQDVADSVYLSRFYFSRLFKEQIGTTYSNYLNKIKIHHVKELLLKTSLSINEIALRTGFPNGNYLCDVFKKYNDVSPTYFRHLNNMKDKQ
jgi:YesN/AraC family two-component response regulator